MPKLLKRKGKWFRFKAVYSTKLAAYKKGYQYRKKYGYQHKYIVIPFKNGMWGLYIS